MPREYEIGVYYFGNYHVDPRNEEQHGVGWTEWELVKRGEPRFPGHQQPKVPAWGYEDESDPVVFAKKIAAAADYGINHFIFDWYWFNDGPFLERTLDKGYMGAYNNSRLKFALMWANHDWLDIHPAKMNNEPKILYPGPVTRETFETVMDHVITNYFRHPSYWMIDNRPYFSFYEIATLIEGLGGIEQTREAVDNFRSKVKAAGFPNVHLNAVIWGIRILPGERTVRNPNELMAALGFDSITSYVWIHHIPLREFPTTDYRVVAQEAYQYWREAKDKYDLPYYPNVTMGWDSSPRTCQSDVFSNLGYPFTPVISNNTPEEFKQALKEVKKFLAEGESKLKIFNINAWNEWTEGSYLEPDKINGMGYLEAIREVFGN